MAADGKFWIGREIRELLLAEPEIAAIGVDKIIPVTADENTPGDFIVYRRDGCKIDRTNMGTVEQSCDVFVMAVSDDYERSLALAELIHTTLEGEYSNPEMSIELTDATEDYEPATKKYMQTLLFTIK